MRITDGRVRVAASDVANFLACRRLTQLDLLRARGELRPPHARDLGFEDLVRRGEEHERAVLERFRADGREVADLSGAGDPAGATAEAIRGGAGVVYQGTLAGEGDGAALFGRPDFLVRADLLPAPDGEPRPDGIHYEVVDAKLARSAKARAVLQTVFYSQLLADVQRIAPRWMHLALGNGEFASFKVDDFAAYERQTRRLLEAAIGADPAAEVYPEPVEHCAICRWRDMCRERRRTDDDLSLVAGITTGQRRALKGAGISTRRGFAGRPGLPRLDRVSPDVLERAQQTGPAPGGQRGRRDRPVRAPGSRTRRRRRPGRQPRAARAARTSRRGPVLRHRGRPLLLRGRPGVRAAVPVRRRRHGRGRRGGTPPVHADLGLRPAGREARVRGADRLHHRTPRAPSRPARLPLQPLRADVGGPSHRAARHPPGGGGRSDGPVRHP